MNENAILSSPFHFHFPIIMIYDDFFLKTASLREQTCHIANFFYVINRAKLF